MTGLTIGEKHTYDDFNLELLSFTVSLPEPVTNEIEIPGMNGNLDLSEALTGEVVYKNRVLTAEFLMEEQNEDDLQERMNEMNNYLHGVVHSIIPDMDSNYAYKGRITVSFSSMGVYQLVTLTADVTPYKSRRYNTKVTRQVVEEGIICCRNEKRSVVPTITSDADFTLKFHDVSVSIAAGENVIPDIKFTQGKNLITCIGTGTITFTYQEGSL